MAVFTRVTLVRDDRRADVVVASDQPLAVLIPRFMDLLGLPAGTGPYCLARPIGDLLDLEADCVANQVADGEVLRIVEQPDAPAAPVVSDVTSLVAALRATKQDVWNERSRRVGALAVIGVVALLAGFLAPWGTASQIVHASILGGTVLILTGVCIGFGRAHRQWAGLVLCAAALGLAVPTGLALSHLLPSGEAGVGTIWVLVVVLWLVLGLGAGVGLGNKAALVASAVCGVIALAACGMQVFDVPAVGIWGIAGVVSVIVAGLVPAWSVAMSGLTGLDDFVVAGRAATRDSVVSNVGDASAILSWCVIGVAAYSGISTVMLAQEPNQWAVGLAGALVIVTALRAQVLPSVIQTAALWVAASAGAVSLLWLLESWWQVGVCAVVAVGAAVAAVIRLPDHVQIRSRGIVSFVGKIGTAATVPLLLGLFGVYTDLLRAFS
ncbi:MAG: hypothetical protein FWF36_05140 [Propionibacteriaceae bacterium]|nr:hypothetical protein [Propionibacteriaceae bacterium]